MNHISRQPGNMRCRLSLANATGALALFAFTSAIQAAPFAPQGQWVLARCKITDPQGFAYPKCHDQGTLVMRERTYEWKERNWLIDAKYIVDGDRMVVKFDHNTTTIPRNFKILGPDLIESDHHDMSYGRMKIHWVRAGKNVMLPDDPDARPAQTLAAPQPQVQTAPAQAAVASQGTPLPRVLLLGSWNMKQCRPARLDGNNTDIATRVCEKLVVSPWSSVKFSDRAMTSPVNSSVNLMIDSFSEFRDRPNGVRQSLKINAVSHNTFENTTFNIRGNGNTLDVLAVPTRERPIWGYSESGAVVMEFERAGNDPLFARLVLDEAPAAAQVVTPPPAPSVGDQLFAGAGWSMQEGCKFEGEFKKLVDSIAISTGKSWKTGKAKLPTGISAGTPTAKNAGEFTQIQLPLSNVTWRGLPVTELVLARGNQTGVAYHYVSFAARPEQVAAAFADWGFTSQRRKLSANSDWPQSASIGAAGDISSLTCNYSG